MVSLGYFLAGVAVGLLTSLAFTGAVAMEQLGWTSRTVFHFAGGLILLLGAGLAGFLSLVGNGFAVYVGVIVSVVSALVTKNAVLSKDMSRAPSSSG